MMESEAAARPGSSTTPRVVLNVLHGLRQGIGRYLDLPGPTRAAGLYRLASSPWRVHDPQRLLERPDLVDLLRARLGRPGRGGEPVSAPGVAVGQAGRFVEVELGAAVWTAAELGAAVWTVVELSDRCLDPEPARQWVGYAARRLLGTLQSEAAAHPGAAAPPSLSEHRGIRAYGPEGVRAAALRHLVETLGGQPNEDGLEAFLTLARRLSTQHEEGRSPTGALLLLDDRVPDTLVKLKLELARERPPEVTDVKHVAKLLAGSGGFPVVIRGQRVVGFGEKSLLDLPGAVWLEASGRSGLLRLGRRDLAVVRDGEFFGAGFDGPFLAAELAGLLRKRGVPSDRTTPIAEIALRAGADGHGATVLIDLSGHGRTLPGHRLPHPMELASETNLDLAASLARVDGALVVTTDGQLHGFGCLLDGVATQREDPARGARFNTALRHSAAHPQDVVVVVSSDGPLTVVSGGQVVYPRPTSREVATATSDDPTLEAWLAARH